VAMIKAIIIDDEPPARSLLRRYLKEINEVQVLGEYENGFAGLKAIHELKPDLIFLDIQMPKLNGFEMLELLDEIPKVIFITAYDQYAVKAFERNAVDYLLKPFSQERLKAAVEKTRKLKQNSASQLPVKALILDHQKSIEFIDRVAVKTGTKIRIIYTDEICYLESQDDYVMIYTEDGKYLKQNTMKYFEKNLPPKSFVRVHRSYIVKLDFVAQIELYERDSYIIKLKNQQTIPVSKSGYNRLRDTLKF
jgi:two-component system LytT family response regulator